jgi:hypothetical protein
VVGLIKTVFKELANCASRGNVLFEIEVAVKKAQSALDNKNSHATWGKSLPMGCFSSTVNCI